MVKRKIGKEETKRTKTRYQPRRLCVNTYQKAASSSHFIDLSDERYSTESPESPMSTPAEPSDSPMSTPPDPSESPMSPSSDPIEPSKPREGGESPVGDEVPIESPHHDDPIPKRSRRNGNKGKGVSITVVTNATIEKKGISRKRKPKDFNNRMSPNGLFYLLGKINDKQRQAVKELGFGGLLELKTDVIPSKLALWLVRNFITSSCTLPLEYGNLRVTEEDVYCTLGLPKGPIKVIEAESESKGCPEFKELLATWKTQWGDREHLPRGGEMVFKLESQVDGGEDFKRNFVVFVVSTCLYGNQHGEANCLILNALLDLRKVSQMNWANYTIRALVKSVDEWKSKPSRFFRGPILFLMLCYLDRVVFKVRTVERSFPTLRGWTSDEVKLREALENEVGFGKGGIEDRVQEPKVVQENDNTREVRDEGETTEMRIMSVMKRAKGVADTVISGISEWVEVMSELDELAPGCEAVKKLKNVAAKTTNSLFVSKTQPPKHQPIQVLSPDSAVSEGFLREVEEIEKKFANAQKVTAKALRSDFSPPAFSLGISSEEQSQHTMNDVATQEPTDVQEDLVVQEPKGVKERMGREEPTKQRPRRGKKELAQRLCSPFLQRNVDAFSKLRYEVKLSADFVFNNTENQR